MERRKGKEKGYQELCRMNIYIHSKIWHFMSIEAKMYSDINHRICSLRLELPVETNWSIFQSILILKGPQDISDTIKCLFLHIELNGYPLICIMLYNVSCIQEGIISPPRRDTEIQRGQGLAQDDLHSVIRQCKESSTE